MKTTRNVPTGWQPDPSGGHELRLFSPEGDPTAHVSDAGLNSYEEMPGAVIIDPPRPRRRVSALAAAGSPPSRAGDDDSPDPDGRTHRRDQFIGALSEVRVNQTARLVARITLLTSADSPQRVRRPLPAFSLVLLAAIIDRN
jgi:hypothetical protein